MEDTPKIQTIDLRRLVNTFITNIRSQATGVTKRCIVIPIDDNYIDESGYTDRNGNAIRTAKLTLRMYPTTEEARARYGKKTDYDLRLDISKPQREALQLRDPATAARLDYHNNAYDRELSKALLPYVGGVFNLVPSQDQPDPSTLQPDSTSESPAF